MIMDYKTTLTTCTYCGCGCNFYLETLDGQLTQTIPCKTSPVNEGKLWRAETSVQWPVFTSLFRVNAA